MLAFTRSPLPLAPARRGWHPAPRLGASQVVAQRKRSKKRSRPARTRRASCSRRPRTSTPRRPTGFCVELRHPRHPAQGHTAAATRQRAVGRRAPRHRACTSSTSKSRSIESSPWLDTAARASAPTSRLPRLVSPRPRAPSGCSPTRRLHRHSPRRSAHSRPSSRQRRDTAAHRRGVRRRGPAAAPTLSAWPTRADTKPEREVFARERSARSGQRPTRRSLARALGLEDWAQPAGG